MTDRPSTFGALFEIRLRLARAALLWERIWPPCWPALAAIGVFFILALFDLLPALPVISRASTTRSVSGTPALTLRVYLSPVAP